MPTICGTKRKKQQEEKEEEEEEEEEPQRTSKTQIYIKAQFSMTHLPFYFASVSADVSPFTAISDGHVVDVHVCALCLFYLHICLCSPFALYMCLCLCLCLCLCW